MPNGLRHGWGWGRGAPRRGRGAPRQGRCAPRRGRAAPAAGTGCSAAGAGRACGGDGQRPADEGGRAAGSGAGCAVGRVRVAPWGGCGFRRGVGRFHLARVRIPPRGRCGFRREGAGSTVARVRVPPRGRCGFHREAGAGSTATRVQVPPRRGWALVAAGAPTCRQPHPYRGPAPPETSRTAGTSWSSQFTSQISPGVSQRSSSWSCRGLGSGEDGRRRAVQTWRT